TFLGLSPQVVPHSSDHPRWQKSLGRPLPVPVVEQTAQLVE
ncbi:hypothetical protein PSYMO_36845, partial [Pseudomonas amygdali pv. mori str. 301020]